MAVRWFGHIQLELGNPSMPWKYPVALQRGVWGQYALLRALFYPGPVDDNQVDEISGFLPFFLEDD